MHSLAMISLALVCLACGLPSELRAWGSEGHEVVCEIAWRRLTPRARKMVRELRRADPEPGANFAESCNWADQARSLSHRGTAEYHYVNIAQGAAAFELERDCPARDCIAIGLRRYALYLARVSDPAEKRAEALKFLGHFVGDVHQPLHAGYAEDRGGNDILVDDETDQINLHQVWDQTLLLRAEHPRRRWARRLDSRISPEQAKRWSRVDFAAWINESFQLAVDVAYNLPEDGRLTPAYFERALPVVEVRIQMAGVRLALLINSIANGTYDPAPQLGGWCEIAGQTGRP